ncbi:uncharacterized protein LOC126676149 [Mercurialis annua]|uniref:uncharacterized protein LOC126676149 n=1 Tax=Mercurialis annua TaxID=3986 RepID=UPI00216074FE|nr:uncharacterized protein LOC126676149 [Mercurialis annua]XP_050226248.1 uncharacterized protein LOC126676149 [Mercurialis annua]
MTCRTTSYVPAEDILLCQIYMAACEDHNMGVHQPGNRFWSHVAEKYNNSTSLNITLRSDRSLQARVQVIERAVRKLNGCIRQVKNMNISGASDQDILNQARILLMQDSNYKRGFKFDHVWNMLKDFEKLKCDASTRKRVHPRPILNYAPVELVDPSSELNIPTSPKLSSKRVHPRPILNYAPVELVNPTPILNYAPVELVNPTPELKIPTSPKLSSVPVNLNNDDAGASSSERSIGMKNSELSKKVEEKLSAIIESIQEENRQLVELLKKTSADRQEQFEVQSKILALKEYKEENKILLHDLNTISDSKVRAFFEAEKTRILEKRKR